MRKCVESILVILTLMTCCLYVQAQVVEIIVESGAEGKNNQFYKEISGKWYESVAKSEAAGCTPNIKSRFADFETNPPSVERFQPNIPVDGDYGIYMTWWRSGNIVNAQYTIHHAEGENAVFLTQDGWGGRGSPNANMWISLGVYPLKAGTDNYVEVTDAENKGKADMNNLGRLYCDAAKFVLTKGGTIAATPTQPSAPPPTQPTPPADIFTSVPVSTPTPPAPTAAFPTPAQTMPAAGINWYTNVLVAQQAAQQQGKGIFVYFFTDTAGECQRFENETFKDPEVQTRLTLRFIPLKFDMKSLPSEAYKLGAYRAPTIILYRSDGTPYRRLVGFKDAQTLLNELQ